MDLSPDEAWAVVEGFNNVMRDEFAFDLACSKLESSRGSSPSILLGANSSSRMASILHSDAGLALFEESFPVKRDELTTSGSVVFDVVDLCDMWIQDPRVLRFLGLQTLDTLAIGVGCFYKCVIDGVFPCISRHPLRKAFIAVSITALESHPMFRAQ